MYNKLNTDTYYFLCLTLHYFNYLHSFKYFCFSSLISLSWAWSCWAKRSREKKEIVVTSDFTVWLQCKTRQWSNAESKQGRASCNSWPTACWWVSVRFYLWGRSLRRVVRRIRESLQQCLWGMAISVKWEKSRFSSSRCFMSRSTQAWASATLACSLHFLLLKGVTFAEQKRHNCLCEMLGWKS